MSTETWLERIYAAGREPVDGIAAVDALDEITVAKSSRPTLGWILRNTSGNVPSTG